MSIIPFDTEDEAVAIANGTSYGLGTFLQTRDVVARAPSRFAARVRNGVGQRHHRASARRAVRRVQAERLRTRRRQGRSDGVPAGEERPHQLLMPTAVPLVGSEKARSMTLKPAAFFRTTLPLDLSQLADLDSGRYHSIWLPDHMVSFWPDSIWTPEFTDLANVSPSPHRHLDALAVAARRRGADQDGRRSPPASSTRCAAIRRCWRRPRSRSTTCRRAASSSASAAASWRTPCPTASTSRSRSAASRSRSRSSACCGRRDGPVDFEGQFYQLHHARLDTEPFEGRFPPIWIGAQRPADAGDHRPLRRRLVAGRRRLARGVRGQAGGRPPVRRARRAAIRWRSCRPTSSSA